MESPLDLDSIYDLEEDDLLAIWLVRRCSYADLPIADILYELERRCGDAASDAYAALSAVWVHLQIMTTRLRAAPAAGNGLGVTDAERELLQVLALARHGDRRALRAVLRPRGDAAATDRIAEAAATFVRLIAPLPIATGRPVPAAMAAPQP